MEIALHPLIRSFFRVRINISLAHFHSISLWTSHWKNPAPREGTGSRSRGKHLIGSVARFKTLCSTPFCLFFDFFPCANKRTRPGEFQAGILGSPRADSGFRENVARGGIRNDFGAVSTSTRTESILDLVRDWYGINDVGVCGDWYRKMISRPLCNSAVSELRIPPSFPLVKYRNEEGHFSRPRDERTLFLWGIEWKICEELCVCERENGSCRSKIAGVPSITD